MVNLTRVGTFNAILLSEMLISSTFESSQICSLVFFSLRFKPFTIIIRLRIITVGLVVIEITFAVRAACKAIVVVDGPAVLSSKIGVR